MRQLVQRDTIQTFFSELAKRTKGSGRVYVTGGVSALLMGWRKTTADIDIKLFPEPKGIFEAIRDAKESLGINIELASPDDFIPALPGWESRSRFIGRYGEIDFYHYDFYAQALAKIERGHHRDLTDVKQMFETGLIEETELLRLFNEIQSDLMRYPAVDPAAFKEKVEAMLGQI
jgi:hypothetical protein